MTCHCFVCRSCTCDTTGNCDPCATYPPDFHPASVSTVLAKRMDDRRLLEDVGAESGGNLSRSERSSFASVPLQHDAPTGKHSRLVGARIPLGAPSPKGPGQ